MTTRHTDLDDRIARFAVRDEATGCLVWMGYLRNGYASVSWHSRPASVHRLVYERAHGPIPHGMTVDHVCRNKPCVEPDHLRLLTRGDNARAHYEHQTHCGKGHEFTPENTYRVPGSGWRHCRECGRTATQRYRAREVV